MTKVTLHQLGRLLREERGGRTVRDVANEVGISASTLSRVERGYLPDLENFPKICRWLNLDPGEVLGMGGTSYSADSEQTISGVHFRAERNITPELGQALAELIINAQSMNPDAADH